MLAMIADMHLFLVLSNVDGLPGAPFEERAWTFDTSSEFADLRVFCRMCSAAGARR
jgi:hypothetical protein